MRLRDLLAKHKLACGTYGPGAPVSGRDVRMIGDGAPPSGQGVPC